MELHFDEPDLFTTGAFGPKGQRVFFIQTRKGDNTAAVKVEKQQVANLADYFEHLLEMLPESDDDLFDPPDEPEDHDQDPNMLLWTAGGLEIGYYPNSDKIVLSIEELSIDEEGQEVEAHERIRILLRRDQTMAFVHRAREIIAAGRPLCQFCGESLNSDDDFCPCFN